MMTLPAGAPADADATAALVERIRAKSAEVLLAVYRLVKNGLVHSVDNAAMRDAATQGAATLSGFATELGGPVTVSFFGDTIFVCGQLLRAPRSGYEAAKELGEMLASVGISELAFEPKIDPPRLLQFAAELVSALRQASNGLPVVFESHAPGIEARAIDVELVQRREEEGPAAQILRLYATALIALRELYEELAQGRTTLPQRVKRLAQKLVLLAEREDPAMLGTTTMAKAHRDDAGRAVQTAILALAMARQVTRDRVVLSHLVVAAFLLDCGRARMTGRIGNRLLSDREEGYVVGASGYVCIAAGGVNPSNMKRAALVTEVAWMERSGLMGVPWGAELTPFFATSILVTARELLERIAPRDGSAATPPLDALAAVLARSQDNRLIARLLVRALGAVPAGTVVELSDASWAVVIGPSRAGPHAALVRVVVDARGNEPAEGAPPIDLGLDTSKRIAKIVDPKRAQFSTTGSFFGR
ncbi:MAG: hypothetical protein JST00_16985 [Deltaproteobacteria bacterium]|nr:hypothetical protein [Deltaproteobacteria bacterium]